MFLNFEVFGKAAHSGGNFEKGISAIGELAHKVVAMRKLTDLMRGTTVNVGTVSGGQWVNTTAPHAEGQIDLRYVFPGDRAMMLGTLQEIIDTATVPGTTAKLEIRGGSFLPLAGTPCVGRLFATYRSRRRRCGPRHHG